MPQSKGTASSSPREEVARLFRQARADLRAGEDNLAMEHYDVSAFCCQQSVEKGLKALWMHVRRQVAPHTHDLTELGRRLGTPEDLRTPLADLAREYTASRYPEAANGVPAEMYTLTPSPFPAEAEPLIRFRSP